MRALYEKLAENPSFEGLAESTEMMAVWDDHDMGWNNANATWPHRDAARRNPLVRDAASEVPPSDRPGVYSAWTFGTGDRTVQAILLDTSYNLDPWDYEGKDPSRRVLGEEQWAWLRERLPSLPPSDDRERRRGSCRTTTSIASARAGKTRHTSGIGSSTWSARSASRAGLRVGRHALRRAHAPSGRCRRPWLPDYDLTPSGLERLRQREIRSWDNPNRVGELLNSNRKHGLVEIDGTRSTRRFTSKSTIAPGSIWTTSSGCRAPAETTSASD